VSKGSGSGDLVAVVGKKAECARGQQSEKGEKVRTANFASRQSLLAFAVMYANGRAQLPSRAKTAAPGLHLKQQTAEERKARRDHSISSSF